MAGMVGMDSPYPPSGVVELSTFNESTTKMANSVTLPEKAMRDLQAFLATVGDQAAGNAEVQRTVLNFASKLLSQPHLDVMEWLRGQAMTTGALSWSFGGKDLSVSYGVPAGNLLANRTGTASYGGSASEFWNDMRTMRSKLRGQVRAYVAHPDTIDLIISNAANKIVVLAQDGITGTVTVQRYVGNTEKPSSDARDKVTLIGHGAEGEILDLANPGKTTRIKFCPTGKIVAIGNPIPQGFSIGQGSTRDPDNSLPIGYTHIGPTVEGGGRPGRWGRVFTPENQPWQLRGEAVTNGLPVIEDPEKIAVASTNMTPA
jgi:hypothetical protein